MKSIVILTVLVVIFAVFFALFFYSYNWSQYYESELEKLNRTDMLELYCLCPPNKNSPACLNIDSIDSGSITMDFIL